MPILSGTLIGIAVVAGLLDHATLRYYLMFAAAIVAGCPILWRATQALGSRVVGIDLLVSVAAVGALIIGEVWEAAAVTTLFAIGNALEVATMNKTREALRTLVNAAPQTALVVEDGVTEEVPAWQVQVGQTVLLQPGSLVPVDGVVTDGAGSADEASITGESLPAEKAVGSQVFAGTMASSGLMWVEATGVGADTTLAKIIHRVEEAQDAKAKTASFMDRFAKWYTPAIIATSLLVGIFTKDVPLALTFLVIACPGALVISIPVAIVAGIGRAARDGVLIKGGEYLEKAAKINAVALDKTGTLTRGEPAVQTVEVHDPRFSVEEMTLIAAVGEQGSSHPLADAIRKYAEGIGITNIPQPSEADVIPGQGVQAIWQGGSLAVGTADFLCSQGISDPDSARDLAQKISEQGNTPVLVGRDGVLLGAYGVADEVRADAPALVSALHKVGVREIVMLTGDRHQVARAVGDQTGIDEVQASLLPEDKRDVVLSMQSEGYTVAMIGDGINDAPALVTADIGVAMGLGTDVAVETADIALMSDNLSRLPHAIRLAKKTVSIMHQNIAIALGTVALLVAGVLMAGVTMSLGMLVHELSVLVVILNAMRLLRMKPEGNPPAHAGVAQPSRPRPVAQS